MTKDIPSKPASAKAAPGKSTPAGDRIAKVLARAGVASRREAERMIEAGRVTVNGKKLETPAFTVTPADKIVVDGKPIGTPDVPRLWLYHKPTGWLRKYRVRVNGRPEDSAFEPLRRGLNLQGEHFQPMIVSVDRQQGANAWLTVGLREGKNREIRRAMEEIGLPVNRLIRVSYGPFQLGNLKQGAVEELRRRVLRDQLGLSDADLAPPDAPGSAPRAGDKPAPKGKTPQRRGKRPPLPKGPLTGSPKRGGGPRKS